MNAVSNVNSYNEYTYLNKAAAFPFKNGETVKAEIVSINGDETKLQFENGYSLTTKEISGKIGEILEFQVKKTAEENYELRQIKEKEDAEEPTAEINKPGKKLITLAMEGRALAYSKVLIETNSELHRKEMAALSRINKELDRAAVNVDKNILSKLAAAGISMNKISLNILNSAITDIFGDAENEVTPEQINTEIEKIGNNFSKHDAEMLVKEIGVLLKNGVNVNEKNIRALDSVADKIKNIKNIDDKAIGYIISKDMELTVNNVYKAGFSSYADKSGQLSEDLFNSLTPSITKRLERDGVKISPEVMNAAKFLIGNDLPVTKENINKYISLKNNEIDIDKSLDLAANRLKAGKDPLDAELQIIGSNEKKNEGSKNISNQEKAPLINSYKKLIRDIYNITDSVIQSTINNNETLTLRNLQNRLNYNNEAVQNTPIITSTKRQLIEISYMLTSQAAMRLAHKGISIDTAPLAEAVEILRQNEAQAFKSNLHLASADVSEENVSLMAKTFNNIRMIIPHTDTVFQIYKNEIKFSINSIANADQSNCSAAERISRKYDTLMTKVNRKYGDSFSKVESQIGTLLENLGIENTPQNQRGASILVRNNVEVNADEINNIKLIDQKLTYVTEKLHPQIAAFMIRDGINPSELELDKAIEYMDNFDDLVGETTKDKIWGYIYDMESKNQFTKEERSGIINIYRMLHKIDSTNGWASGFVSKNNFRPTLENLLEASKFYDKTKAKKSLIDVNIDNEFGMLQANEASVKTNNEYLDRTLKNITDYATPEALKQLLMQNGDGITKDNIESVMNELIQTAKTNTDQQSENIAYRQTLDDAKTLSKVQPQIPAFLERSGIPVTVTNIKLFDKILKNPSWYGKQLNEFENTASINGQKTKIDSIPHKNLEKLKSTLSASESITEVNDEVQHICSEILSIPISALTEAKYSPILMLGSVIEQASQIQDGISKSGNYFQLPVRLNDEVSTMNFYVINENTESQLNILISLDTKNIGNVQASINTDNDKNVSLNVVCENPKTAESLLGEKHTLFKLLQSAGFNVNQLEFTSGEQTNILSDIVTPKQAIKANANNNAFDAVI